MNISSAKSEIVHKRQPLSFSAYTVDDGLPLSQSSIISQDHLGYLWLASDVGLSRFDGYQFKEYSFRQTFSEHITALLIDSNKNIWVGTKSGSIYRYNQLKDEFQHILLTQDKALSTNINLKNNIGAINGIAQVTASSLLIASDTGLFLAPTTVNVNQLTLTQHLPATERTSKITFIIPNVFNPDNDRLNKHLWAIINHHTITKFNHSTQQLEKFTSFIDLSNKEQVFKEVNKIYQDPKGQLWATAGYQGLLYFDAKNRLWKQYNLKPFTDEKTFISDIIADNNSGHWITTKTSGLIFINKNNQTIKNFKRQTSKNGSLTGNYLFTLYIDFSNNLWLSEVGGLNKTNLNQSSFTSINSNTAYNQVNIGRYIGDIVEQNEQYLWFESHFGLSQWNLNNDKLTHFSYKKNDYRSISDNTIMDLILIDERFLIIDNSDIDVFDTQLSTFSKLSTKLPPNSLNELSGENRLFFDSSRHLLVATNFLNLLIFDDKFQFIKKIKLAKPLNLTSAGRHQISGIATDSQQNIWLVINHFGLVKLDKNYSIIETIKVNTSNNNRFEAIDFLIDKQDQKWIGTKSNGLALYKKNKPLYWFNKNNGFIDNRVYAIEEDDLSQIWASTNHGLVQIHTSDLSYRLYNKKQGLVGSEFNSRASHHGKSGNFYFGGIDGLTIFKPELIKPNPFQPSVVFTSVKLLSEGKEKTLKIDDNKLEAFSYNNKIISLNFSSLDFTNSDNNQYAYRLNQNEWISLNNKTNLIFTDLPSNDYHLEIKGSNSDGVLSNKIAKLYFIIETPPWLSLWAIIFYFLLFLAFIFYLIKNQMERLEHQRKLIVNEKKVTSQLRRLNQTKDRILANTSHEMRTPLNGIIGLNKILIDPEMTLADNDVIQYRNLINTSAQQLLSLITDLLDVSKLQNETMKINFEPVDLNELVNDIFSVLHSSKTTNSVKFNNNIDNHYSVVNADKNRIRQVLYNLISNSLKFTDEGAITIITTTNEQHKIVIAISDTGIGIAKKDHQMIFDSFIQVDASNVRKYGGAGLGLTICQEILNLHHTELSLHSELGVGSTFSFKLEAPNLKSD